MSVFLIVVSGVLFGGLWGCVQGMVMIQAEDSMAVDPAAGDGVRNHAWFGAFHRLCLYCALSGGEFAVLCFDSAPQESASLIKCYMVLLVGVILLGWEAAELMYSYARYGRWIGNREHLVIADVVSVYLSVVWTRRLHVIRAVCGTIIVGLVMVIKGPPKDWR